MPGYLSRKSIRLLVQLSSGQAPLEVIFYGAVKYFHIVDNFVLKAKYFIAEMLISLSILLYWSLPICANQMKKTT